MPDVHRTSIAIRLAAAIEVEAIQIVDDSTDRPALIEQALNAKIAFLTFIRAQADQLLMANEESFKSVLDQIPEMLSAYVFDHKNPAVAPLIDARARLIKRLASRSIQCSSASCAYCDDVPLPPEQLGKVPCIREIVDLARNVEDMVRAIYEPFAKLPQERVRFITRRTHAAQSHGLFQQFHISGSTDVQIERDKAIVCLQFKDQHFDWPTLCQTLYVLAHEMVCHAFQACGANERENADERCGWSEGWMDGLAWSFTEAWIEHGDAALPDWLRAGDSALESCYAFHQGRYSLPQPGSLDPTSMNRRKNARAAFRTLRQALDGSAFATSSALAKATEFSVRLNACALDAETRDEIVVALIRGLASKDTQRSRFENVIGSCSSFCDHNDPVRLLKDLKTSVNGLLIEGLA